MLYLAITLLLNYFDKDKLANTTKVTLFFFPVIIIVPFLDYLVFESGSILYTGNFQNLTYKYINLFNIHIVSIKNITNGVRVEIFLVMVSSFIYIYALTNSFIKSFSASFLIYSTIFLFGYLPAFTNILNETQSLHEILNRSLLPTRSIIHLTFYMYLPLIFLLMFIIQGKLSSAYRYTFFDAFRFERLGIYIGLLIFGFFFSAKQGLILNDIFNVYDILVLVSAILSLSLAFAYATIENNIVDIRIDTLTNKQRPLVKNLIDLTQYKSLKKTFLTLSLILALTVNKEFILLMLTILSLSHIYSTSPFRYKKFFLLANFILALIGTLVFIAGSEIIEGNSVFLIINKEMLSLIFIFFFIAASLKDIKDIKGDEADSIITLPILIGVTKSLILLKTLLFIVFLLVLYLLKIDFYFSVLLICFYALFSYKISQSERFLFALEFLIAILFSYIIYRV